MGWGALLSQEHKRLSQGWTMKHNQTLQKVATGQATASQGDRICSFDALTTIFKQSSAPGETVRSGHPSVQPLDVGGLNTLGQNSGLSRSRPTLCSHHDVVQATLSLVPPACLSPVVLRSTKAPQSHTACASTCPVEWRPEPEAMGWG